MLDWLVRAFDYLIALSFVAGCISAIALSLRPTPASEKIASTPLNRPAAMHMSPKSPPLQAEDTLTETAGAG